MKTPAEIISLAGQRLEEAKILYANNMVDGAFYLAGYAVELTLKAKCCNLFGIPNLYDDEDKSLNSISGIGDLRKLLKTHNLSLLLVCSGLKNKFDVEKANNKDIAITNSLLFNCWDENARYKPCGHKDSKDVGKLLTLLDGDNGLLKWIRDN